MKYPQNLYTSHPKYPVTVDCVFFRYDPEKIKLLLYLIRSVLAGGAWSLTGGYVPVDESLKETGGRVFHGSGCRKNIYLEQGRAYRDLGGRAITMASYALMSPLYYMYKNNIRAHNRNPHHGKKTFF